MKIALFDFVVAPHSGPGGCDVEVLRAISEEHEVTVFASNLVMPEGTGRSVTQVAVPTVRHPGLASFLLYLAGASVSYARLRLRGERFDVIQATDSSFPFADVCYAHLCHRAFLAEIWPRVRGRIGPRTAHSWANHKVRAVIESNLVRRARVIVVPSDGLRRDIERSYPSAAPKITVIRNTVDVARYAAPGAFDRRAFRERMGTTDAHTAFVFVALGHFERKGLPMLLEALGAEGLDTVRLWVVGGEPGLVESYRRVAERLGVVERVTFAGRTDDVRPFLWSADAFVAPSHYEAFSLALLEAAAAGLPLIATRISGSEELVKDGVNGLEIERSPAGVSTGLHRFLELHDARREAMGRAARESVEARGPDRFAAAWKELYASVGRRTRN